MSKALGGEELAISLRENDLDVVEQWTDFSVWVTPGSIVEVARFLKEEPNLYFNYLSSISAVDFVDHFEMVYHLTSFEHNHTAVVKARVPGREDPTLPSVVSVWQGADLQEREIWDLMGIRFSDHPNLKRIFLWEGFQGNPLRKDFQDTVEY
jgi:NADH-quinone oxidoreductase subunit C